MPGQPPHSLLLTKETRPIVSIQLRSEYLDRNRPVQHNLPAAVDHTETTVPDLLRILEPRCAQLRRDRSTHVTAGPHRIITDHQWRAIH